MQFYHVELPNAISQSRVARSKVTWLGCQMPYYLLTHSKVPQNLELHPETVGHFQERSDLYKLLCPTLASPLWLAAGRFQVMQI